MPRLRALDTFRCLSEYKQNKIKLLKLIATRARLIRVILMSYVLICQNAVASQSSGIPLFNEHEKCSKIFGRAIFEVTRPKEHDG